MGLRIQVDILFAIESPLQILTKNEQGKCEPFEFLTQEMERTPLLRKHFKRIVREKIELCIDYLS